MDYKITAVKEIDDKFYFVINNTLYDICLKNDKHYKIAIMNYLLKNIYLYENNSGFIVSKYGITAHYTASKLFSRKKILKIYAKYINKFLKIIVENNKLIIL